MWRGGGGGSVLCLGTPKWERMGTTLREFSSCRGHADLPKAHPSCRPPQPGLSSQLPHFHV